MGDIIEFQRPAKPVPQMPVTFWDKFKDILRKYYTEETVHLAVAAIYDKDCYDRASPEIRQIADIYNRFAP
jgi:hypothetical protein